MRRIAVLFLVLLAGLMAVTDARAQETVSDNEVNQVAKELYCPVCPNTPLDVCETQACQDWREEIKMKLSAGSTNEEILDYFVEQYGERVLAEPQRKGFTSMVWILPVVAVLLGLVVVVQALRSWKSEKSAVAVTAPGAALDPDTLAQIEQELRRLE